MKKNIIIAVLITLVTLISMVNCSDANEKNKTENSNKTSEILEKGTETIATETITIEKTQKGTIYKEYDLGEVLKSTKELKRDFTIKNNSGKAIVINYAVTSCDCTIAVIEDEKGNKSDNFSKTSKSNADMEVEDGKSITIHLNLDLTEEEIGTWIKILRVFDDYDEKLLEIELTYNIIGKQ